MELKAVETDQLKDDQHLIYGRNILYAASADKYVVGVYELPLTQRGRKRTLDEKLDGLEFLVGGDHDFDFDEDVLKINGFQSRLVTYTKSNAKGLMLDAGDTIYVLFLLTKDRKDLDSEMAKKFFSSFTLLK
jgi:hypothetical protein